MVEQVLFEKEREFDFCAFFVDFRCLLIVLFLQVKKSEENKVYEVTKKNFDMDNGSYHIDYNLFNLDESPLMRFSKGGISTVAGAELVGIRDDVLDFCHSSLICCSDETFFSGKRLL